MKMRVRGNSIRLRLTQSEVAEFGKGGLVEEVIEFGTNELIYVLESRADTENITAEFKGNRVVITVPQQKAEHWTNSNEVGIKAEQDIGGDRTLRLLIEKDFACLEQRGDGEEDTDTFPNPSENAKC